MPRVHVAIIDVRLASGLLDGRKHVETRFARQRRLPYGRISVGDRIYFKICGQHIIGRSSVKRVQHFDDLTPGAIEALRQQYNRAILGPPDYWHAHRDCRFGVLIWLGPFNRCVGRRTVPRQYGAGWVLLSP